MMRPPEIIILDGATGAGKSTLLAYLRDHYRGTVRVGRKLTTRPPRKGDNDWEFRFVAKVPPEFNEYSFGSVSHRYAIDRAEIDAARKSAEIYAISCVDRSVIEKLGSELDSLCVYVYRVWKDKELDELLAARGSSAEDIATRKKEVASIPAEYATKLDLYDHVILNDGATSLLQVQFDRILAHRQVRSREAT